MYLGKRAESFLNHLLETTKRYNLLTHNLQIQQGNTTIGELDAIVYDTILKKYLHIEQVYKVYVYDDSIIDEYARWIGPNRKDSLAEKLEKLKSHQFPMLFHAETKKYLDKLNLSVENIEQRTCFMAHLFIPKHISQNTINPIFKHAIRGYTMTFTQFESSLSSRASYAMPEKRDWMLQASDITHWYSANDILDVVQQKIMDKRSPMIWIKDGNRIECCFILWW